MKYISQNKRLRFSKEDDIQLKEFVQKYGEDWNLIASLMEGKNSRQVKDRYMKYLSPDLNHNPWIIEEDELLKQKINEMGKKWNLLVKFFPNRTDIALKNRWIIIERSERKQKPIDYEKKKSPIQRPSKIIETFESEINEKQFWDEFEFKFSWFTSESNIFW